MKKIDYRNNLSFVLVAISPLLLSACGGSSNNAPIVASTQTPNTPAVPLAQKQDQTITSFNVTPMKVGDSTTVTATASSGLPVTFSSDTAATCSVTADGVVTAVGYGTCTIAANQFGNDTYRQITTHSSGLVIGIQSLSLALPQLIVGERIPLVFKSTAALPVTLTSNTPSTCTVLDGIVTVVSTVPAACTITASQDGVTNYVAPAASVTQTTSIVVATTPATTAPNALTNPLILANGSLAPQDGSLVKDGTAKRQGFYSNSGNSIFAFLDNSNNITYIDSFGVLFGLLNFNSSAWSLDSSSIYYSNSSGVIRSPTGSGTQETQKNLQVTTLSFNTNSSPLTLNYSGSNAFAVNATTLAGNWYTNTATSRTQIAIDSKGNISGTLTTLNASGALPSRCVLTGTIGAADLNTSHNLFNMVLTATTDKSTGTTCALSSNTFQGPAVQLYNQVTSVPANGFYLNLFAVMRTTSSIVQQVSLLKESP